VSCDPQIDIAFADKRWDICSGQEDTGNFFRVNFGMMILEDQQSDAMV
jgi:hypothetical protein